MDTKKFVIKLSASLPTTLKELSTNWNAELASSLVEEIESGVANAEKGFRKILAPLTYCKRTLSGAIEGLEDDLIEVAYAQRQVKKLVKTHCKDFRAEVRKLEEKFTPIAANDVEGTFTLGTREATDALRKVAQALPTGVGKLSVASFDDSSDAEQSAADLATDSEIIKKMAKARREVALLPTTMDAMVALVQAPVVPIADSFKLLQMKTLQLAGISAIVMLNYKILENQWLLAVNVTRIKETVEANNKKGLKHTTVQEYLVTYVNSMLTYLNKNLNSYEKFEIFSTKAVSRQGYPGIVYYWLMRIDQLDAWMRAGMNSSRKLRDWQFPDVSSISDKTPKEQHARKEEYDEAERFITSLKNQKFDRDQAYSKYRRMMHDKFKIIVDDSLKYQDIFDEIWKQRAVEPVTVKKTITKKVLVPTKTAPVAKIKDKKPIQKLKSLKVKR